MVSRNVRGVKIAKCEHSRWKESGKRLGARFGRGDARVIEGLNEIVAE